VGKSGWTVYLVSSTLLTGFLISRLEAATYYVDPINGDMSNDGSYDSPWETLQGVFDNRMIETRVYETWPPGPNTPLIVKNEGAPVKAGDIILLRSGYHGSILYMGALNLDYITIAAQEGHTPLLGRFFLQYASKWILRGVTISPEFAPEYVEASIIYIHSCGCHGLSSDIIIENNRLFSVQDASPWTTLDLNRDGSVNLKDFAVFASHWQDYTCEQSDWCGGSDFNRSRIVNFVDLAIFSDNFLHDWNTMSCRGIYVLSSNSIVRNNIIENVNFGIVVEGDNILIEHNKIENLAGDGIVVSADNVTVQYNTIKNFYKVNHNHDDGMQFHRGPDNITPIYNATIRGNFIISHDPNPDNPFLGSPQGIGAYGDNPYIGWLVENNVVLVQHSHGITIYGAADSVIANNIAFDPTLSINEYGTLWEAWVKIGSIGQNTIIRNNMSRTFPNPIPSQGVVVDHCIDIDNYNPEDLFVDYQNHDMHHKEGSPAVDGGSSELAPVVDIEITRACAFPNDSASPPKYRKALLIL